MRIIATAVVVVAVVISFVEILFLSPEITLVDADTVSDDIVGHSQTLNLNGLELGKVHQQTFVFHQVRVTVGPFHHAIID